MEANAELIAGVAGMVAAIVVTAQMVRFNRDVTGDEKGGGFGDISAWRFIKPVLLLLAIELSPQMASLINSVVTDVMSELTVSVGSNMVKTKAIANKTFELEKANEAYDYAVAWFGKSYVVSDQSLIADINQKQYELERLKNTPLDQFGADDPAATSGYLGDVVMATKSRAKENGDWDDPETWLGRLYNWAMDLLIRVLSWMYDAIIYIRLFMGNIAMCVLLMFFPLVFLAMFFDRYKGAFGSFMLVYVELSLWQPIAAVIVYATSGAITAMTTVSDDPSVLSSLSVLLLFCAVTAGAAVGSFAKYALTAFTGQGGGNGGHTGLKDLTNSLK